MGNSDRTGRSDGQRNRHDQRGDHGSSERGDSPQRERDARRDGEDRDGQRNRAPSSSYRGRSDDASRARRDERGSGASRGGDHDARERGARRTRQHEPADWDDVAWRGDQRERRDARGATHSAHPDDRNWERERQRQSPAGVRRTRPVAPRYDDLADHDDDVSLWGGGPRDWNQDSWRDESNERDDAAWTPPAARARGDVGQAPRARSGAWNQLSARLAAATTRSSQPPAKQRARMVTYVMLAVILVCAVGSVPMGLFAYSNTMGLAKDGMAELKLAEGDFKTLGASPTNLAVIADAQSHLQRAHDDFAQLQLRAGLLSPAQALPKVGSKVGAAVRLAPLAVEGTQAGILACDALKALVTGLKNPLGANGGLTAADVDRVSGDMDQIRALFGQMSGQIAQLQPADLTIDPRLGPLVAQVEQRLPQITQLVSDLDNVAHALPQLLGVSKPATYLVLILDSSELRPTGGFIGNFGALTLDSGRLDPNFHIRDITLIDSSVKFGDAKYQQVIPLPGEYDWLKSIFKAGGTDSWSVRDSNLEPDFPTSSRYALDLYAKLLPDAQKNITGSSVTLYNPATSGQFAGVLALSLGFFQQALGITGPITISDGSIHETVNAQNFVSKIHYYALAAPGTGPDNQVCGDTSCAKVFTSDVVKGFMAKVKANLSQYLGGLAKLFYDSLKTKDIEVYLTNAPSQHLLSDLKVAAEVVAPATGDSVFEVEANIGANKDNAFLKYIMRDTITIDQSGAATHTLTWTYTWPNDPATLNETFAAGVANYHSYSRVFTPPGASLIGQRNLAGFGQSSASSATFKRKVFYGAAYAYAVLGTTNTYSVSWKVPGVVTHDSAGYHYHLLFQREAGIVWPLTLTVALPSCAKLSAAPQTSGFTSADTYAMKGTTFTMSGPLTQDLQTQLDYTC